MIGRDDGLQKNTVKKVQPHLLAGALARDRQERSEKTSSLCNFGKHFFCLETCSFSLWFIWSGSDADFCDFRAASATVFAVFAWQKHWYLRCFCKMCYVEGVAKKKAKKHVNFSVFGHHVDVGKNLTNSIVFSRWVQKHCK